MFERSKGENNSEPPHIALFVCPDNTDKKQYSKAWAAEQHTPEGDKIGIGLLSLANHEPLMYVKASFGQA